MCSNGAQRGLRQCVQRDGPCGAPHGVRMMFNVVFNVVVNVVFNEVLILHVLVQLRSPLPELVYISVRYAKVLRGCTRTSEQMRSPLQLARKQCCNVACVRRAECGAR